MKRLSLVKFASKIMNDYPIVLCTINWYKWVKKRNIQWKPREWYNFDSSVDTSCIKYTKIGKLY